ncbi:MAG: GNAT family N-acetyltransferase, partial [Nitrosomonas sp.]
MLDVDGLLHDYFQQAQETGDKPLMKAATSLLKKLLHQDEINRFIEKHRHLEGLEFNDAV